MSGGSWDYFYYKVEEVADRLMSQGPSVRRAFGNHLHLVAAALKDIEWVDSGDCGEGTEIESIKKVISNKEIAAASAERIESAIKEANEILKEIKNG